MHTHTLQEVCKITETTCNFDSVAQDLTDFFYDSHRFRQYLKLFHLEKDDNAPYNVRIFMNLAFH